MLNQQIGPYKIISELGEGGMAMVYLAEKGALGKQIALKVLKKEFIYNQHIRGRFLSEAKKMINLNHPNIVGVQDLIDESDFVAIELEYIEGETLKQHLHEKGALPDDEIESLFEQMLDAVGYVHKKGYIHRDIKPSNFMLTQSGIIKLTDFGIAKNADDTNIDYTGTGTGMQMGTPKYMSPEQVRSTKDVDHRSDIYSLGVVLWEMVTGKVPYDIETESTFDVFEKIVHKPLEKTNTHWDNFIQKATQKKTKDRYEKISDIKLEKQNVKVISPLFTKKNIKYLIFALLLIVVVTVVFKNLQTPQWKISFNERWENISSNEKEKDAETNLKEYTALLNSLPAEADDERELVKKRIEKYNEVKDKQKQGGPASPGTFDFLHDIAPEAYEKYSGSKPTMVEKKDKWGRSPDSDWYGYNPDTEEWTLGEPEGVRLDILYKANPEAFEKYHGSNPKSKKNTANFGTFTDPRDNKIYKTIKIGDQTWMAENLAYKPPSGNYWEYDNNSSNVVKYGYLYDWETACKVCPDGWYLPSDTEWTRLTDYLGGENVAGTKMKNTSGWTNNGNGTNLSGFSGLPGGFRNYDGTFTTIGYNTAWWSSTEYNTYDACGRDLNIYGGYATSYCDDKDYGFSVRCLRD